MRNLSIRSKNFPPDVGNYWQVFLYELPPGTGVLQAHGSGWAGNLLPAESAEFEVPAGWAFPTAVDIKVYRPLPGGYYEVIYALQSRSPTMAWYKPIYVPRLGEFVFDFENREITEVTEVLKSPFPWAKVILGTGIFVALVAMVRRGRK